MEPPSIHSLLYKASLTMSISHFVYPFFCWWTHGLLLGFCNCKHSSTSLSTDICFHLSWVNTKSRIIRSSERLWLIFKLPDLFSKQLYHFTVLSIIIKVPVAPNPHQQMVVSVLNFSYSDGCAVVNRCSNLHFPND